MAADNLKPHEQRVVTEYNELELKCQALTRFFGSQLYCTLPTTEQGLLTCQSNLMEAYLGVLRLRIAGFHAR